MKTTPGPWIARHNGHFWEVGTSLAEFAHSVAHVPQSAFMPGDAEANARLLASAPDLLAENGKLKALNVELVAALAVFVNKHDAAPDGQLGIGLINGDFGKARAALAKNQGVIHG